MQACKERWQGFLAEDEMAKQSLRKFGDLTTADHKASSLKVNFEPITDVQSWCKILSLNGFNLLSVQRHKLLRRRREVYDSFSSRQKSRTSFTLTFYWNLANPVKICHVITFHRSETNVIAERAARRITERTSVVLLQSSLDETWWADSMECWCYLRNVQDLLTDGKTLHERRFGEPFKDPVIPLATMTECYPISARDQSRFHQFGKKILSEVFLGYASIAGGIWKGDVLIADIEELENMEVSEVYLRRINTKEVLTSQKEEEFVFPGQMKRQICHKETTKSENPLQGGNNLQGEDLSGELQGESEGPQPTESKDDAEARRDFWSVQDDFIHLHHNESRVQFCVSKEKTFPITLKYNDVTRATCANLDMLQETHASDCWNGRESKFIVSLEQLHKVHIFEREFSKRKNVVRGETDKNSSKYRTSECVAWSQDQKWRKPLKWETKKSGQTEAKSR